MNLWYAVSTRQGEYDKNNTAIQETLYLGDTPVAVVKPDPLTGLARTFYIHADHLNAPRVIVNTANKPVWRWDNSDAFGLGLPDQDPDGNTLIFEYNLRFPGQYYDKQTGLFYNYQRYYDPFTGRYISADPLGLANGLAGSVNPYSYVEHNPLNSIDPFGLELTVGFGQGIRNLADGAKLPNGGEGVVSMSGPGSPLGPLQCAADAASSAAPIGKLGAVVGGLGKGAKGSYFYRGAKPGNAPDLTPRPNDFKVDSATGTVKPTHGVSVFDNPNSVSSKGFVPHKVDQSTIPDSLQIIQRGKDPAHFEITPKPGTNLTPQQFIDACSGIGCSN